MVRLRVTTLSLRFGRRVMAAAGRSRAKACHSQTSFPTDKKLRCLQQLGLGPKRKKNNADGLPEFLMSADLRLAVPPVPISE